MPDSLIASRRIATKMQSPLPAQAGPWRAPDLVELIARIDAALETRRAA